MVKTLVLKIATKIKKEKSIMLASLLFTLIIMICFAPHFIMRIKENFQILNQNDSFFKREIKDNLIFWKMVCDNWDAFVYTIVHFLDPIAEGSEDVFSFVWNLFLDSLINVLNAFTSLNIFTQLILLFLETIIAMFVSSFMSKNLKFSTSMPGMIYLSLHGKKERFFSFLKALFHQFGIYFKRYKQAFVVIALCLLAINSNLSALGFDLINFFKTTLIYIEEVINSTDPNVNVEAIGMASLFQDFFVWFLTFYSKITFYFPWINVIIFPFTFYMIIKVHANSKLKRITRKRIDSYILKEA